MVSHSRKLSHIRMREEEEEKKKKKSVVFGVWVFFLRVYTNSSSVVEFLDYDYATY